MRKGEVMLARPSPSKMTQCMDQIQVCAQILSMRE